SSQDDRSLSRNNQQKATHEVDLVQNCFTKSRAARPKPGRAHALQAYGHARTPIFVGDDTPAAHSRRIGCQRWSIYR
ncbi:hypothetical protein, partial [Salinispora fenicalii]|uniref:hypothetical protein n=1 Tax=Salinispora fenicalii TaxID=1137263 RepID=UPI001CC5FFC2